MKTLETRKRGPVRLAAGLLSALLLSLPLLAGAASSLDAAKQTGLVGEKIDGYIGVVRSDAPADVKAMVEEINARRRAAYAEIAAKNGTALEVVERLAGAKLVAGAPAGEYVLDATGRWKRK